MSLRFHHITSWSAVTTQADSLVLRGSWVFRNLHNLLHVALPCFISLYVCCWILLPLLPDPQILELSMNCGMFMHCYHSYLQGNDAFSAHGTHFSRVHVSTIISFRPKIHFIHGVKMNSTNWPAPNAWVFIAQLVRALQR